MMVSGGSPTEFEAIKRMSCDEYLVKLSIFVGSK